MTAIVKIQVGILRRRFRPAAGGGKGADKVIAGTALGDEAAEGLGSVACPGTVSA